MWFYQRSMRQEVVRNTREVYPKRSAQKHKADPAQREQETLAVVKLFILITQIQFVVCSGGTACGFCACGIQFSRALHCIVPFLHTKLNVTLSQDFIIHPTTTCTNSTELHKMTCSWANSVTVMTPKLWREVDRRLDTDEEGWILLGMLSGI